MRRWCACVLVCACATNCTKANPNATCANGTCTDPAFPYCDVDGSVGGTVGECIAVSCTAGEIKECQGSQALTCNTTGDGYELDDCALGCGDGPSPHCLHLQPKYLPNICDTPAHDAELSISSSGALDPSLDTNCTGGVVTQAGADEVCVLHYGMIDIAADANLTIVGAATGGRVIAFVADQELSIEGTLDISGHTGSNGPGGGTFTSGAIPQTYTDPNSTNGGGGAGGATEGGAGGSSDEAGGGLDGGANNGGTPTMNPATLVVLVGGPSSPLLDPDNPTLTDYSYIGGGGGAMDLVSCRGTVSMSGTINAAGGGGAGAPIFIAPISGFGGGAGGNVVIEGASISITGSFFANGGAGGGGAQLGSDHFAGPNGAEGSLSDTQPAYGASLQEGDGTGGNGGFIGGPPTSGQHAEGAGYTSGGGGGSVGFLQTYTPAGVTPTITPSHASPAFQPNGTVQTR